MGNTIKLTNASLQTNAIKLTNTPLQNVSVKNTNGVVAVGATDHSKLSNRDLADQHPISAITGLQEELDSLTQGVVYTPSVSSSGVISWTNNGGLTNPKSVNIKGAKGDKGEQGIQGVQGEQGVSGVYVGTGDMPSGYNVQIDPSGTTVEYATKTELDKRVEFKAIYKNELDDCFNVGETVYKIIGETKPSDGMISVDKSWRDYYVIVKGWNDGNGEYGSAQVKVGIKGVYVRTGLKNVLLGTTTWSEWTVYATRAELVNDISNVTNYVDTKFIDFENNILGDFSMNVVSLINDETQARETADNELSAQIGDIDTALDNIIAIQNELIGGGTA